MAHVRPKSMGVLVCLADAAGEVVSRNDLFDAVWPGSTISDDVLTQSVVELRKAFRECVRDVRVIETVPKIGFRLVPPVMPLDDERPKTRLAGVKSNGRPVSPAGKDWWNPAISTFSTIAAAMLIAPALYGIHVGYEQENRNPVVVIEEVESIAVLPIVDLSPNRDQEYFADGLSEELLARLAEIRDIRVAARTASFYFRGKNEDLQTLGKALNVGHILAGSVRTHDNRVRITLQLADTLSGYQLWSGTYDRELRDILSLQDEIAGAVTTAVRIKFRGEELAGTSGSPSPGSEADLDEGEL